MTSSRLRKKWPHDAVLLPRPSGSPCLAAAAREISALDGIDCIFVGSSDLAADMGHVGPLWRWTTFVGIGIGIGIGSDLAAFRSATQALCDRYRN